MKSVEEDKSRNGLAERVLRCDTMSHGCAVGGEAVACLWPRRHQLGGDHDHLSRAFVSPTLVGRAEALTALHTTLTAAAEGTGHIIVLAGEAGMGKSRLVGMTVELARELRLQIASGQCSESEQTFPFAPFSEMLSQLLLQAHSPRLGSLQAAYTEALQAFSNPAEARLSGEISSARYRLFQSLSNLLITVASQRPLLLILEDGHWCDDSTLEFLGGFARHLGSLPVCVMLTYRDDELTPGLRHLLTLFDRTRLTTEIHLSPLGVNEVETMLQAIFDLRRPVQREFALALTHLSGGNPFFVEELLKSLMAGGDLLFADVARHTNLLTELRVPRTIDETMQRRLPLISPAARRLLTVLAVAGRTSEMSLLQEVLSVDENTLVALIAEGIAAQFLRESGDDTVAFRHDLTRQAVYNAAPKRERRQWHLSVAVTMERHSPTLPEGQVLDLARHWYLAQQWEKALETNRRAGELAQAWHAPQAAITHYTNAIEAASRLYSTPPVDLLRARAQAAMTIGALESARSDFETVLALASSPTSTSHDVGEQWQAFLDLGFAWDGIDYERTRSYYQQAFDLAQSSGKPLLIARSSNRIGNWHMNMEQPEEGLRYQQQALAIFVQANATEDIIETHILIAYSGVFVGDLVLALSHFRQAIALARQSDNRYSLSAALGATALCSPMHSTDTMLSTLSLDEASDHVEEAGQLARTIGWRLNEAITSTWRAGIANARGDFGAARRFAEEGVAIAEEMAHPEWQSSNLYELGNIASDTYDYDAAKAYLEHALGLAKEMRSLHFQRVMAGRLAGVLALSGQCEGARATLARVVAPDEPMLTPGQRECWYGYARIALSEGNPRTALDILQRLASAASAPALSDVPWLALLGGEALLDLGHFEEAATLLGDAYRVAQAEEWRLLIWRLGALWGRALYARGAVDEAAQIWAESRTYAETLAASIPKESERAAFLQGVSTAIPTLTTLSLPRSPRQPPRAAGDLTRRELEVARLVALGHTNRQIARALIISEETATVHVKHILHKLQFTSRSQIAAWVVDQRLDISPDR